MASGSLEISTVRSLDQGRSLLKRHRQPDGPGGPNAAAALAGTKGLPDLEAILAGPEPARHIQSLDVSHLHIALHQRGLSESLEVLRRLSTDQFVRLADLECWENDRLDVRAAFTWLQHFGRLGETQLSGRFRSLDEEYQLSLLSGVRLVERELFDAMPDDVAARCTPLPCGQLYYMHTSDDPVVAEGLTQLVNALLATDVEMCYAVLKYAFYQVPHEAEQLAQQFRNARLEEEGYLTLEESHALFRVPPRMLERVAATALRLGAGAAPSDPGESPVSELHAASDADLQRNTARPGASAAAAGSSCHTARDADLQRDTARPGASAAAAGSSCHTAKDADLQRDTARPGASAADLKRDTARPGASAAAAGSSVQPHEAGDDFLRACLQDLHGSADEAVFEALQRGFVQLANGMARAVGAEPGDIPALVRAQTVARGLSQLGLAWLAGGSRTVGVHILRGVGAKELFQAGLGAVQVLRDEVLATAQGVGLPASDRLVRLARTQKFGSLQQTIAQVIQPVVGFEMAESWRGLFARFPLLAVNGESSRLVDSLATYHELRRHIEGSCSTLRLAARAGSLSQLPVETLLRSALVHLGITGVFVADPVDGAVWQRWLACEDAAVTARFDEFVAAWQGRGCQLARDELRACHEDLWRERRLGLQEPGRGLPPGWLAPPIREEET